MHESGSESVKKTREGQEEGASLKKELKNIILGGGEETGEEGRERRNIFILSVFFFVFCFFRSFNFLLFILFLICRSPLGR